MPGQTTKLEWEKYNPKQRASYDQAVVLVAAEIDRFLKEHQTQEGPYVIDHIEFNESLGYMSVIIDANPHHELVQIARQKAELTLQQMGKLSGVFNEDFDIADKIAHRALSYIITREYMPSASETPTLEFTDRADRSLSRKSTSQAVIAEVYTELDQRLGNTTYTENIVKHPVGFSINDQQGRPDNRIFEMAGEIAERVLKDRNSSLFNDADAITTIKYMAVMAFIDRRGLILYEEPDKINTQPEKAIWSRLRHFIQNNDDSNTPPAFTMP